MRDEDLRAIWNRAGHAASLSRGEIETLLKPIGRRSDRALSALLWTYLTMLATTLVLAVVNLFGYRGNPVMLAVEVGIGAAALSIGVFSVRCLLDLRRASRRDLPLLNSIESRLDWIERAYTPWLGFAATTPVLLTLAINTWIDNDHGTYPMNHPGEFVVVIAVMIVITFFSLRVATQATVYELRATLSDLRAQALEETPKLRQARDRTRRRTWLRVALVALVVALTVGLWVAAT